MRTAGPNGKTWDIILWRIILLLTLRIHTTEQRIFGGNNLPHFELVNLRRYLLIVTLTVMSLIAACGGASSEPLVVEKEVIKEVVKEIPVV
jgi:hypothetical protein